MPNVRRRIEGLERSMARMRGPDPYDAMQRVALQSLGTEDLMVLADIIEQGKLEGQWTEREAAAMKALSGAFAQEVQRAGYRSVAEFQRCSASGR